jgi:GTP-binding protein Era
MRSGFISIIGRPNVGKSTLLNKIVGEKIAITSNKPQTTRNLIQGVYTKEDTQIVFVDTPGIHKPVHKLGNKLNAQAYYSRDDVDAILLVMDAKEEIGKGDKFVIDKLKDIKVPIILALNKIDKLSSEQILKKIDEVKDLCKFDEIVPISAATNDNIDRLLRVLEDYLTDNVKYFPDEDITSSPIEFRLCEIVREKILELTDDEVPHSVACVLSDLTEDENTINIYIDIIVDREPLKKIIIGKQGLMLKEIGIKARTDMEHILGKQVYLELYVKTLKKWRDKEKYLNELGFNDF